MQQNGYAEVDVNQLAFDDLREDSCGVIIPIKGSRDHVFCSEKPLKKAWRAVEIFGCWYDSRISPETTNEIYKKLEGYIAW